MDEQGKPQTLREYAVQQPQIAARITDSSEKLSKTAHAIASSEEALSDEQIADLAKHGPGVIDAIRQTQSALWFNLGALDEYAAALANPGGGGFAVSIKRVLIAARQAGRFAEIMDHLRDLMLEGELSPELAAELAETGPAILSDLSECKAAAILYVDAMDRLFKAIWAHTPPRPNDNSGNADTCGGQPACGEQPDGGPADGGPADGSADGRGDGPSDPQNDGRGE